MKRSDITDLMVCYACLQGEDELNSLGRLMEGTGAPEKVCLAAMRRADARGLIDWGVNIAYAWPTDEGRALMDAEHQRLSDVVAQAREQGLPMTSGEVMEELRARQEARWRRAVESPLPVGMQLVIRFDSEPFDHDEFRRHLEDPETQKYVFDGQVWVNCDVNSTVSQILNEGEKP